MGLLYWYVGRPFKVTFHLITDVEVTWTRIHGVRIGRWFFGAVASLPSRPDRSEKP